MAFSQAAVVAPAALAQLRFAGLGRRLAAYFVDMAIVASGFVFLALTMRGLRGVGLWRPGGERVGEVHDPITLWYAMGAGAKGAVVLGFVLSMGVLYFALFESSAWQATFGKRLLDIHVTNNQGRRIGVRRAVGRWFWKFFLGYFGVNIVSLVTIPCVKNKKALHDYMANTLVVRGGPIPGGSLESWRVVAAFGIPFVWMMATFLATV
ncbi:MAG TPA: RDD family protein [Terriglobales bacterium]|nr:RDD family protein [Terriglobales bacterium]